MKIRYHRGDKLSEPSRKQSSTSRLNISGLVLFPFVHRQNQPSKYIGFERW